jgi:hypothetical protein
MCFSRIKNIKSLTSKNSGTLIVIKAKPAKYLALVSGLSGYPTQYPASAFVIS